MRVPLAPSHSLGSCISLPLSPPFFFINCSFFFLSLFLSTFSYITLSLLISYTLFCQSIFFIFNYLWLFVLSISLSMILLLLISLYVTSFTYLSLCYFFYLSLSMLLLLLISLYVTSLTTYISLCYFYYSLVVGMLFILISPSIPISFISFTLERYFSTFSFLSLSLSLSLSLLLHLSTCANFV